MTDSDYRQRLRADADAGNRVAERLLLLALLADQDTSQIEDLLARCGDLGQRHYLQAELRCFHGWPGSETWQELLQSSAAAGHSDAQQVIDVYHDWARSSDRLPADASANDCSNADWHKWRVPQWTSVISGHGLDVEQSTEFAPRPLIAYLRRLLGQQLQPSAVIDPATGQAIAHPHRINRSAQWLPEQLGWVGKLFESRLAIAAGHAVERAEVSSLLHYSPGQQYKAHFDFIANEQATSTDGVAEGGQRTHTILLAMGDDDFEGGETYFPRLGSGAKAATGELLKFNNTDENGEPLRYALHEGQPVTAGEKWLLSKWIRADATPYGREISLVTSGDS